MYIWNIQVNGYSKTKTAVLFQVEVPRTEPGYPPVREPTDKKDDFFHRNKMKSIDEKARQVIITLKDLTRLEKY